VRARASEKERIRSPSVRSSEFEKNLKIDGHRVSQLRCGSAPPHGDRFVESDKQIVECAETFSECANQVKGWSTKPVGRTVQSALSWNPEDSSVLTMEAPKDPLARTLSRKR